jgi:hypothetical protein
MSVLRRRIRRSALRRRGSRQAPSAHLTRPGRLPIPEDDLRRLYLEENLPERITAGGFGVSTATINQKLRM